MTFVLEDKNTGKKYDFLLIMKHRDICGDILERMESEGKKNTECYKKANLRLKLILEMNDMYDYIYLDENKLKRYRRELEDLEEKTKNGIITEMYYLDQSNELLKLFQIISRQLERKKRMIELHLKKYLDSFKPEIKKIYKTVSVYQSDSDEDSPANTSDAEFF
jgi:hypothetical protein